MHAERCQGSLVRGYCVRVSHKVKYLAHTWHCRPDRGLRQAQRECGFWLAIHRQDMRQLALSADTSHWTMLWCVPGEVRVSGASLRQVKIA